MKLTKVKDSEYSHHWTAEDTKYFENIEVNQHYRYQVEYTLKKEFTNKFGVYTGTCITYDLRLQKNVKEFISQLDVMFEKALEEAQIEEEERQAAWDEQLKAEAELSVFYGISETPKVGDILNLKFANLNKNNTIGEYRYEVKKGDYQIQKSKVEKVVHLSTKEFDSFSNSLMDGHEFLGEGGTYSNDDRLQHLEDVEMFKWSKELLHVYRDTCFNIVTAIVAPERQTIFSDAQGYKYARYVAFK